MQLVDWRAALAAGAERVGWKIGRGLVEGEEDLEPALGHLTTATRLEPGEAYDASGSKELRVDAELAIEVGANGSPVRYAAALELVDVSRPPYDFESIVAGNIWHRGFAVGALQSHRPPALLHAVVRVSGRVAGSREHHVDATVTPRIVGEILEAVGERLEVGDCIICGSLVHVPVAPGDDVTVELAGVGDVGVRVRRETPGEAR